MLLYQSPHSTMTLREALDELRAAEGDVSEEVAAPLAAALEAHDAVHIIFGLDISDLDEVVAHGFMAFGTTLTLAGMHRVTNDQDHRRYSATFAHGKKLLVILRALPRLAGAFLSSRRMTRPWPFENYGDYLDVPLDHIRREFGIILRDADPHRRRPRGPHHAPVSTHA